MIPPQLGDRLSYGSPIFGLEKEERMESEGEDHGQLLEHLVDAGMNGDFETPHVIIIL